MLWKKYEVKTLLFCMKMSARMVKVNPICPFSLSPLASSGIILSIAKCNKIAKFKIPSEVLQAFVRLLPQQVDQVVLPSFGLRLHYL